MKSQKTLHMREIILTLVVVMLCSVLSACGEKPATKAQETPVATTTEESTSIDKDTPEDDSSPEYGSLIESGIGLNENYFADVSYFGTASDLTENSFILGRMAMVFHGSEPYLGEITIHYGENTQVRTAVIQGDTYKIYSASPDDLQKTAGDSKYRFDVVLEDPEAEELWAKEIRIVQIIFD